MRSKASVVVLLFFLLYLFSHVITIHYNPLPWLDEVLFASISKNVMEEETLVPQVSEEIFYAKEYLHHGPLFYYLESLSLRIFGIGIFEYRWITLLFGVFCIYMAGKLYTIAYPESRNAWLLMIVLAFDPYFTQVMHEGRMETMALFFFLSFLYMLFKGEKEDRKSFFFYSGIFLALSLLTSIRFSILAAPWGLVFLFLLEGKDLKNSLAKLAMISFPVLLLYLGWIVYAFGGITGFVNFYKDIQETKATYFGGNLFIPRHEYFLIFLCAISVAYGLITKRLSYFNPYVFGCFLSILAFYFFIYDFGPYSPMIIPFYYFLFFHGIGEVELSFRRVSVYLFIALFMFNLSFFSLKSLQVFSDRAIRSASNAERFVKEHIPAGSRVIGDPHYYYAVIKAGSSYRLFDHFSTTERREQVLREEYDYEYFIVTERSKERDPALVAYFLTHGEFRKVATLAMKPSELSVQIGKSGIVSNTEVYGYNAEIYVRIRDTRSPVALNKQHK